MVAGCRGAVDSGGHSPTNVSTRASRCQEAETPGNTLNAYSIFAILCHAAAGVLEIVEDYDGDTYRSVYTVNFREAVYVLHVFQKKSKHGIATPTRDLDLVRSRYRSAERHYATLKHQEGSS